MKELSAYKKQFDRRLTAFFNTRLKAYQRLGRGTIVPSFIDQTSVIALAGGKRFRPYLAALSHETFGGKSPTIDDLGMSLELFHLFGLTHDDIVDKGVKRHGVETVHIYTKNKLHSLGRLGEIEHIGKGQAIFAGDLLFMWSQELFIGNGKMDVGRRLALDSFRTMMDEVFVGEMIDIDLTTQPKASHADIERKNILKTARYTFVCPIRVGARLATGNTSTDKFSKRFGEALGSAYQIQDDMLDVLSESGDKTSLVDVSGRQHTYLTYYIQEEAAPKYRRVFNTMFGAQLENLDMSAVKSLYIDSGAVQYAQRMAALQFKKSRAILMNSPVPKKYIPAWEAVIDIIENRKS